MADQEASHDHLIAEFCVVTDATHEQAEEFLTLANWQLGAAVSHYFSVAEDSGADVEEDFDDEAPEDAHEDGNTMQGGGRTLGGSAAPQHTASSSRSQPTASAPKKKFATLGDLGSAPPPPSHSHDNDEDDDGDDDYEPEAEARDLFAGGEKSGLAVQDPNDLKRKILEKAKKNQTRPGGDDPQAPTSHFRGAARTLGGDDTPSREIPDPAASAPKRPERVERKLHFWPEGFSVDDGPLYRNDDPANTEVLQMIRKGRAPLAIMNVTQHQEVDVKVEQHTEKYVPPKKKWNPFGGGGQRLGSPVPGESPTDSAPAPVSQSVPASSAPSAAGVTVNDLEPTISLQIRLRDGTRLLSRFNTSHTIGDVYSFVIASSPSSAGQSWVLMTTFPSKELSDKSVVLGDLAEFKRGGVIVQKGK